MATASETIAIYNAVLQRNPTDAELANFVANSQTSSAQSQQIDLLVNSSEANSTVDPVVRVYQATFGRVPDKAGLDFWTDFYRDSGDVGKPGATPALTTLNQGFVNSDEFKARFPTAAANGTVTEDFLNALYQQTLGRAPDQAGKDFYLGKSIASTVTAFAQSSEFINLSNSQVNLFLNKAGNMTQDYAGSVFDTNDDGKVDGADSAPPAGQTFTLTIGQDTASAATFEAPTLPNLLGGETQTLNSADKLTGVGTDATLNATLNTAVNVNPELSGIANVNLRTTAVSNLDLGRATGVKAATHIANVAGADLSVLNIGSMVDVGVSNGAPGGGTDSLFQFQPSVLAGTTDTVNVKLSNNGSSAATSGNVNIAGLGSGVAETLNVAVTGTNRINSLSSDVNAGLGATTATNGATTYKFAGDGSIRINTQLTNATTVDGSGLTAGGMRVIVDPNKAVNVTGGAGADNVDFLGGLTNADKFVGGAGRDTLQVSGTGGLGVGNQISEVEILQVNGATAFTFDNDDVTSIDTIKHNSTAAMVYQDLVGANAADATKGVSILNIGNITTTIKGAGDLGATNDAIYFNVGDTGTAQGSALQTVAGLPTGTITANNIETITFDVKADDAGQTASGTGNITATTVQTVNVKGGASGEAFALGAVSNPGLIKIDGSTFTGNLTATLTNADDRDQLLLGGSGNDVLSTGGAANAGNDGGRDVLTGNGGNDTFNFVSSAGAGNDMFYDGAAAVPNFGNATAVGDTGNGNGTNGEDIDVLAVIDGIADLNFGGAAVGSRVDVVQVDTTAGSAAVTVLNGGSVTALTGAGLGAALDSLFATGGQLDSAVASVGLYSFGGKVFLAGTDTGAADNNFTLGDDFVIEVTGQTGTFDASDFAFV